MGKSNETLFLYKKMPSISAVIITYNEARNIERCLLSLQGIADEIIVVDSFSSDATPVLSRSLGARVVSHAWLGFGPQKNLGIDEAQHSWILSLDSDEELDDDLRTALLLAKAEGLSGVYAFSRLNSYYGKFLYHGAEYPDVKIRLFPKGEVRWNKDLVHEDLVLPPALPVKRLKGFLLHYTFYSISEQVPKSNRYSTLGAELYAVKGKQASWFKLLFSPFFTFVRAYIFKRGFLDGKHGFVVAVFHAYTNFMKYAKLWEIRMKEVQALERK